ncbi:recombinase family protein [Alkalibacillus aidingensis]|uniref:recombinase family protein n=1 Tax=Alkalibacillus aidingensis TaxID=2747607 RepID=UPI001CB74FE5|nr:recombinase family protein [Alkalibacillus aidingensis]
MSLVDQKDVNSGSIPCLYSKKPKHRLKRAVGYTRRSPRKQLEDTSIEKQTEEIIKYCERNGIELVEIYTDDLKSAKSFDGRDAFKEMYNRTISKKENIDYIIVLKQDRISRDTLDTLYIMKRLNSLDKHLISIADNINTEDPKAEILVHIMSLVAQLEREFIAFRTNSGMEKKAEDGYFLGGKVFGYKTKDKELIIDPDEAKIVKYIFEKYAFNKWGYKKIASKLNIQGVQTKYNNEWTINSVKTILQNQIYIGNTKWREEYKKGQHSPIIEMSLWNKVKEVMQSRTYTPKKVHPGSYPLSGLLKCPQCGSSMVQGNSSQKYKYYQCSKNKNSGKKACSSNLIKKEYAEEFVQDKLITFLNEKNLSPIIYDVTKSNLSYELEPLEKEANNIKGKIQKHEEKLLTTIDLMSDTTLNLGGDLLKEKIVTHQEDINREKSKLESISKQLELKQSEHINILLIFRLVILKTFILHFQTLKRKSLFTV